MSRIAILAAALMLATPATADGLLLSLDPGSGTTSVEAEGDWESPRLTVHEESCDFPPECAIVGLSCESWLRVSIEGVEQPALARWLSGGDELSIDVKGIGGQDGDPYAVEMLRSYLDGSWSVIFQIPYRADPGLSVNGNELSISSPIGATRVSLTGANRKALDEFTQLCARE